MDTFDFCPNRYVPETLPREGGASTVSMNGWQFSAKPNTPYQRRFKITLHGLRWYLNGSGYYDNTTNPTFNAKRLEEFYERNETWQSFLFQHQHIGPTPFECRFLNPVAVPAGLANSGGFLAPLEIQLIHHNPSY